MHIVYMLKKKKNFKVCIWCASVYLTAIFCIISFSWCFCVAVRKFNIKKVQKIQIREQQCLLKKNRFSNVID